MSLPQALQEIVDFFEPLEEDERRDALLAWARGARTHEPRPEEHYAVVDERRDAECLDRVGVYLRIEVGGRAEFRVRLGPEVQTLTRALAAILCAGLRGSALDEVVALDGAFLNRIVGAELVRQRSRTAHYVLARMREACRQGLDTVRSG